MFVRGDFSTICGIIVFLILALFIPAFASAGSANYTTPGTYTFSVPAYSSLTVQVWGAGGGGGEGYMSRQYGSPGGASSFGGVVGYGGAGGAGDTGLGGAGGSATGGSTNTAGASGGNGGGGLYGSDGGAGGASPSGGGGGVGYSAGTDATVGHSSANGGSPGGGGGGGYYGGAGGGGGYSAYTYSQGQLSVGGSVTVVVGSGGTGTNSGYYDGASGASGQVSITWTDPPPASCSVTFTTNPIAYSNSTTLNWTSSNANSWVYISNIGYVGTSGSTSVGPLSTTNYSCEAYGSGGTDGWHNGILTVNAPANCTFNGTTVTHGSSVTAYQASTVPYGSSCVSQTRTCNNGTLSNSYAYSSCSVGPQATVTISPGSITQGQSATISWSSINATSCTGTNFSTGGATSGSVSVSPSQTTTYTCSCTGAGGTAACNAGSGTTLTVSCTPAYTCTGTGSQTITYKDAQCQTSNIATCTSPQFCSSGSSVCLNPNPSFNVSGALTGHLQVFPKLVKRGNTVKLFWNVSNVLSCAVTGNGETKTGLTSGASGAPTNPITTQTIYTLTCPKYPDGSTSLVESQPVNITPEYREN